MPRVYLCAGMPPLEVIYVVSQAVGNGCPNQRDDVLLVQFFLRVVMEPAFGKPGLSVTGEGSISIDGICGQETIQYIRAFQVWDTERNPMAPLNADGKVHPPQGGTVFDAATHRLLTISSLNLHYLVRRPDLALKIYRDPLFPQVLVPSLVIG